VDVFDDEYNDIAEIIDSYDEEKEPYDPKLEHVQKLLNSLIDNTAAYLDEQGSASDAQATDSDTDGAKKAGSHDLRSDVEDATGVLLSGSYKLHL
jgi:hypothetical protein